MLDEKEIIVSIRKKGEECVVPRELVRHLIKEMFEYSYTNPTAESIKAALLLEKKMTLSFLEKKLKNTTYGYAWVNEISKAVEEALPKDDLDGLRKRVLEDRMKKIEAEQLLGDYSFRYLMSDFFGDMREEIRRRLLEGIKAKRIRVPPDSEDVTFGLGLKKNIIEMGKEKNDNLIRQSSAIKPGVCISWNEIHFRNFIYSIRARQQFMEKVKDEEIRKILDDDLKSTLSQVEYDKHVYVAVRKRRKRIAKSRGNYMLKFAEDLASLMQDKEKKQFVDSVIAVAKLCRGDET